MKRICLPILLALSAFLIGCASPLGASNEPSQPSPSPSPMEVNLGQTLPISAQVKIANQTIRLEVARTPEQQAIGLMYRTSLAADRGMLFPFKPARRVGFWMKNVSIPLDMIFLRNGRVEFIASNAAPCQTDPCPTYGPSVPIDQVIELRGGRAAELGLKPGD
ncbi:DUF192 domain-containing protein, partial [Leptolyngbya sp. FACHB-36]|uniref:DUF192 domain-containing protein n=1 Tax=Leptolyngbya sp. FACHB-36 TaxID=2692808 RepID=UPI001681BFAE